MQYGVLPGGGSPKRPKNSPARIFGSHIYNQVRRPSRFRGRLTFIIFGVVALLILIYGRQQAVDISRSAYEYIPDSITDVIQQYGEFDEQRWDDGVEATDASQRLMKKPKFHLLIPANKPTLNLCKTLMTAAILKYPPPTLISYTGKDERPGADNTRNTFNFLDGKEAHEDDLILVVEEDAWFQLPADITISRFFHGLRDSNVKLHEKYGKIKQNNTESHIQYTMKVLFGSAKECSNGAGEPACDSIPQSPLPKDIYGDETDRHPEGKYNRPRHISSSMVMGRVADLRPIYKAATELLDLNDAGKEGSQYVFAQLFGLQEYARSKSLASTKLTTPKWLTWLSSRVVPAQKSLISPPNITLSSDKNYELGIGLDYFSSIFQVMNNSAEDVRFVSFNHPSVIASPSRISAHAFQNPIRLPSDLGSSPPPYFQDQVSLTNKPDPPITELDNMHDSTAMWTDIELSTNVIVPGSSVPASLNFHGSEYLLDGDMWEKMWFHADARALMRQYIRSPDGPLAATAAAQGGESWWDLRGGKGGVWTDRGEWLDWGELCGEFDEKLFGDGKGEFMRESVEVGGQEKVYKFGQLVQGKPEKGGTGTEGEQLGLVNEAMKKADNAFLHPDGGGQNGETKGKGDKSGIFGHGKVVVEQGGETGGAQADGKLGEGAKAGLVEAMEKLPGDPLLKTSPFLAPTPANSHPSAGSSQPGRLSLKQNQDQSQDQQFHRPTHPSNLPNQGQEPKLPLNAQNPTTPIHNPINHNSPLSPPSPNTNNHSPPQPQSPPSFPPSTNKITSGESKVSVNTPLAKEETEQLQLFSTGKGMNVGGGMPEVGGAMHVDADMPVEKLKGIQGQFLGGGKGELGEGAGGMVGGLKVESEVGGVREGEGKGNVVVSHGDEEGGEGGAEGDGDGEGKIVEEGKKPVIVGGGEGNEGGGSDSGGEEAVMGVRKDDRVE